MENELKSFIAGCKRQIGELKQNGLMKVFKGKHQLHMSGYRVICEKVFSLKPTGRDGSWDQGIFGWCYTTLSWNLICRSITTGDIFLPHLFWKDDSLHISVPTTKSDKEGDRSYIYHVYSNVNDPKINTILALSVYIFTRNYLERRESKPLFEGNHSEKRFSDSLKSLLKGLTEAEVLTLGSKISDIGTHSIRKGAASYCMGIEGPNPVMVHLRAGWSLGNVANRYLFQSKYYSVFKINYLLIYLFIYLFI